MKRNTIDLVEGAMLAAVVGVAGYGLLLVLCLFVAAVE